jgi:hypothetical protein
MKRYIAMLLIFLGLWGFEYITQQTTQFTNDAASRMVSTAILAGTTTAGLGLLCSGKKKG